MSLRDLEIRLITLSELVVWEAAADVKTSSVFNALTLSGISDLIRGRRSRNAFSHAAVKTASYNMMLKR